MTQNQPLQAQLYSTLLQRIRSGAWEPGGRVPSEKALVAEFGTSREPVRQALAALRSEGMIVGGRGAPPRVQRPVPSQSFATFRSFTEWARSAGFTPGQRVIEVGRRPATEPIARELRLTPEDPVIELLRLRTLDGEPALLERSTFPCWVGVHLLRADLEHGSVSEHLRRLHIAPARARHVVDAVAATQLDAEWLSVAKGTPLLRARRAAYDEHGAALEYADDRHLPSMTTFAVENSVDPDDYAATVSTLSAPAASASPTD